MMNGNYGGGWMMIIGVLVCFAIIVAVVWLVMRLLNNKQATSQSAQSQQQPHQMNELEYQLPPQQSSEAFYEDEKLYSYPQSEPYPQQQERPLD
jgi:predicted lipid-binding transport protein (Tim44 family)